MVRAPAPARLPVRIRFSRLAKYPAIEDTIVFFVENPNGKIQQQDEMKVEKNFLKQIENNIE